MPDEILVSPGNPADQPEPDPGDGVDEEAIPTRRRWSDWLDCSGCDCDFCDGWGCNLLRVSTLLSLAALLVPARSGGGVVLALLRGYRRRLSRFTPRCPSTPSCSAYAVAAVQELGPRRGLLAAAARVRACRPPVT